MTSPAHHLGAEQRENLSIKMMSGNHVVTQLAKQNEVSPKFLYKQKEKAAQALHDAFQEEGKEEQVLMYIPVTKAWLHQLVLCLILHCRSSYRGVIKLFADALDHSISLGTIHNIVHQAIATARPQNQDTDLSSIDVGANDELFHLNKPILAGVGVVQTRVTLFLRCPSLYDPQQPHQSFGTHEITWRQSKRKIVISTVTVLP